MTMLLQRGSQLCETVSNGLLRRIYARTRSRTRPSREESVQVDHCGPVEARIELDLRRTTDIYDNAYPSARRERRDHWIGRTCCHDQSVTGRSDRVQVIQRMNVGSSSAIDTMNLPSGSVKCIRHPTPNDAEPHHRYRALIRRQRLAEHG
jgi:hypothetical protein